MRVDKDSPELHKMYIDSTLRMGEKVDIMCSLKRGSRPVSFTWYKDNRPVRAGQDGYQVDELAGKSILQIERIERRHIGNYTCGVSNALGTDSYTVPVVVEAPPSWSLTPSDTTAPIAGRMFLHCAANGYPLPTISWARQIGARGEFVPVQDTDRITLHRNGTLTIKSAKVEDAGLYRCEAENAHGKLRQVLTLTISAPPVIIEHDETSTIRRGHSVRMRCEATGDSPITLIWTKDERLYQNTYVEGYDIIQRVMPGGIRSELLIHNTTPGDAGMYTCKVSNPFGQATALTRLQVLEPPFPPLAIRVTNIASKQVRLNWQPPISVVNNYIVRYWKEANGASKSGRKLSVLSIIGSETSAFLADLHPGTTYAGYMLSENGVGTSGESGAFKFTTLEEPPNASPLDVKLVAVGAKFFKIQWKGVPEDHRNGKITGYNVGHKQFGSDVPFTFEQVQGEPGEAIVRGLQPNSKYSVVVHAFNNAGSGPPSHRLVVSTLDKDLPGPPNFAISHVTSTSVSVQIREKTITNHVTQFVLSYREAGLDPWKSVFFPPHTHTLNVEGLNPRTSYELTIASYSVHGRGESSKPMAFKTTDEDDTANTILAAHSGLLTADNIEIVLSEPRLFLPLLFCLTLVVSSIVTAYACYKRVVAKYTVFNNPPGGAPVLQYQTVQGAYGVLEREYCVLQQKLYGAAGSGYYGAGKGGEVMYDMPYDAVISTSLPVHNTAASLQAPDTASADSRDEVATLAQPKDCYTMLKGKDNRQSYIVAPAVPEKDEALRATLRAEKAMKIRKELQEARANGTIIQADIHSSDDYLNDESDVKDGTFIQPTENSDPEDTDNDGDDLEPEIHTEPTELGTSSNADSNPDVKGNCSSTMAAHFVLYLVDIVYVYEIHRISELSRRQPNKSSKQLVPCYTRDLRPRPAPAGEFSSGAATDHEHNYDRPRRPRRFLKPCPPILQFGTYTLPRRNKVIPRPLSSNSPLSHYQSMEDPLTNTNSAATLTLAGDTTGDTSDRMDATELLMKSPSDTAVVPIEPEPAPAPPALPVKARRPVASPEIAVVPVASALPPGIAAVASTFSTTPTHIVPDLPPPPVDDYDVNWPAPPPPEGLE
ncbi:hypothetical protein BIW11_01283 [Tropilaelaps mercedesae]|uniref:Down syndrome cell adhesion molecule protein Dscam2-like n=1 Tax=Tropilaelaps mercedesae TaxID=418985 RepID=A0A1V9XGI7_9ACAR|nr:hypothetical protein BIW11_01283 [Tropilaelaps mercedesae]